MTAYHGGKQRLGKRIAKAITDNVDLSKVKGYCEPFCGMLGVYRHVPTNFCKYKAGDLNLSVIKMWEAAQKGWVPPTQVDKETFDRLKREDDSAMKGFVGHQFSFGGQFLQGFYNRSSSKASKRVCEIGKELKKVKFYHGRYTQFSDLEGFIIYCDPPYLGTECRYSEKWGKESDKQFWEWCKTMAKKNEVFVSGYSKPEYADATCIFENTHIIGGSIAGRSGQSKKRTERLFKVAT